MLLLALRVEWVEKMFMLISLSVCFTHLTNISFDDTLNGLFIVMINEVMHPLCCFVTCRYWRKQFSGHIVKSFGYAWNFISLIWCLGPDVFRISPILITHMFSDTSRFLMSNTDNISVHLWPHSNTNSVASFWLRYLNYWCLFWKCI